MNIALTVVVSAIVVLIVALVVITIFSGGAGQIGGFTSAEAVCTSQGASTCAATGQLPVTWTTPTVSKDNKLEACSIIKNCQGTCAVCGFTAPSGASTGGGTQPNYI